MVKEGIYMTIREKIDAVRKVQGYREEISNRLEQIIKDTSDYHCDGIRDFRIDASRIFVAYEWTCRGEHGVDDSSIPIEWLDDGFDYRKAYEERMRKAELARIREEEKEKRRLEKLRKEKAKLKEKKEYEKYLELKKKYEGKQK